VFRGLDVYTDWGQISDVPCTWMVGTDVGFFCVHPESRRECVVLRKMERENGVVQWREDGEVAAWSSKRRAMHPSFMTRHSEARKTYRLRRYMIAQVSWVKQTIDYGEEGRRRDPKNIFFVFLGWYEDNKESEMRNSRTTPRRELPVSGSSFEAQNRTSLQH
jgi:hypothetical protein